MKEIIINELKKYGCSDELIARLMLFNERDYLPWIVKRLVVKQEDTPLYASIEAFADLIGLPEWKVRYAYFSVSKSTVRFKAMKKEYTEIRRVIDRKYPCTVLWDEFSTFDNSTYNVLRDLAIEVAFENGDDVEWVVEKFGISKAKVYRVRRNYLKRLIDEKAEGYGD